MLTNRPDGHLIPLPFIGRGVGRNISRGGCGVGGRFKWDFPNGSFCIDLFPNTLFRKCIKICPKKVGGRPTPPTPLFLRP